jgi:hypothetical protein
LIGNILVFPEILPRLADERVYRGDCSDTATVISKVQIPADAFHEAINAPGKTVQLWWFPDDNWELAPGSELFTTTDSAGEARHDIRFCENTVFPGVPPEVPVKVCVGHPGNHWDCKVLTVITSDLIQVNINIKPGSDPNSINAESEGVIPVAILTTEDFDALTVDADSVVFGEDEAEKRHKRAHVEDVDDDGDLDLLLHFRTQETGIAPGDTEACLIGHTYDGVPIMGCDSVRTVPPN